MEKNIFQPVLDILGCKKSRPQKGIEKGSEKNVGKPLSESNDRNNENEKEQTPKGPK